MSGGRGQPVEGGPHGDEAQDHGESPERHDTERGASRLPADVAGQEREERQHDPRRDVRDEHGPAVVALLRAPREAVGPALEHRQDHGPADDDETDDGRLDAEPAEPPADGGHGECQDRRNGQDDVTPELVHDFLLPGG